MSGIGSKMAMAILPLSATSRWQPYCGRLSSPHRQHRTQLATKAPGKEEAREPALLLLPPPEMSLARNRDQSTLAASAPESDNEFLFVFLPPPNSFANVPVLWSG